MNSFDHILTERLSQLEEVKSVFRDLYPDPPARFKRGDVQVNILSRISLSVSGFNRRIVNEALSELGYERVKIQGILFYRKRKD